MKRLSLLRNLGLISGASFAIVPVVMTSTSCAITGYSCDIFDYNEILTETTLHVKTKKMSFNDLLYGSKKNHNGNYVLFVGSVVDNDVCHFFGNSGSLVREKEIWKRDFYESSFFNGLVHAKTTAKNAGNDVKDIGFYNMIDFFDFKFYDKKNHEIKIYENKASKLSETINISPFTKWTQDLINATKSGNKLAKPSYDWDETSVKVGDYIRNDDSAKAYRAMIKRGLELYPKTDKRKDTFDNEKGTPKMLIFKDGKLVSINAIPGSSQAGYEAFGKTLFDTYKVIKDEKK